MFSPWLASIHSGLGAVKALPLRISRFQCDPIEALLEYFVQFGFHFAWSFWVNGGGGCSDILEHQSSTLRAITDELRPCCYGVRSAGEKTLYVL